MGVQDDYNEAWEAGAKDATERCALLVEVRAEIARKSALSIRERGSFTVWNLWPLFTKSTVVLPKFERSARDMEAFAHVLDVLVLCMRLGYDPRTQPEGKKDEAVATEAKDAGERPE